MGSDSVGRIHKVAVVQAAPVAFDTARTLAKTVDLAADARRRGAKLALFPEAFISVYPRGLAFGTVVGSRSAAGREQFRLYWESAIDVPGPDFDTLAGIARSNEMHLVIGVMERSGGTLYCTVLFFAPDGRCLGKHRKLMPTAAERLIWGSGDGSTLPVLETPVGRVGAVICWENYMPLLRTAMYAKGIEIYCAPTADGRDTWLPTATNPRPCCRAAAAASSGRSARSSPAPTTTAKPSSPPTSTSPTSPAPGSISTRSATTPGPTSSSSPSTRPAARRWPSATRRRRRRCRRNRTGRPFPIRHPGEGRDPPIRQLAR